MHCDVYDNALSKPNTTLPIITDTSLVAYMNIIYYHHSKLNNVNEKIAIVSTCFPPSLNGDWSEVVNALMRLNYLVTEKYVTLILQKTIVNSFVCQTGVVYSRDQRRIEKRVGRNYRLRER